MHLYHWYYWQWIASNIQLAILNTFPPRALAWREKKIKEIEKLQGRKV
jgi:hypothetical protein